MNVFGKIILSADNYRVSLINNTSNPFFLVEKEKGKGKITIDCHGKCIIPKSKDIKTQDYGELILAIVDGKWHYINNDGIIVWKDETDCVDVPKNPWDFMSYNEYTSLDKNNNAKYKSYFDSRIHSMDIIEGLYFVYCKHYINNRNTGEISITTEPTMYYSIHKYFNPDDKSNDNFISSGSASVTFCKDGLGYVHDFEFQKIGNSNIYNVVLSYAPKGGGKLIIDNPQVLKFSSPYIYNNQYVEYFEYELIRDYPTANMIESVGQTQWSGSGFAIADGLIATNYHVVNGAKNINIKGVKGDIETAYSGFVLATDKEHDIALIKIVDKNFKGFGRIPYCVGKSIADVGEDVFALGYPLTTTMGKEVKLTNGIISSTSGFQGDVSMYQISVPLQPGNSGGPLFDDDGIVTGIVTAKHADAENANYAVKINYLASLISNKNLDIKLADNNKIKNKSLKKKVKAVKNFVYLIECSN